MNRIIFDDNDTQSDHTVDLENYHGGSMALSYVSAEDALYIGSIYPINSLYFKVTSANVSAATVNISYFNGSGFQNMIEIFDETAVSGATMAQSGHITMVPDRNKTIGRYDTDSIDEIDQLIYDRYWYKMTFSADCAFTIGWVGQIFSNDDDLGSEYPDLVRSNVMTAIESGKTDYEEQHARASALVIEEMSNRRKLEVGEQVLERRALRSMSLCKVAEIVYNMLGDEYIQQRDDAAKEFQRRIDRDVPYLDRNFNGLADPGERVIRNGFIRR